MNMQNLMAQAQRMQRDIMKKKEEVEKQIFEGESELVKVTVNGKKELIKVVFNDGVTLDDLEILQDMVVIATNKAFEKVDNAMENAMGQYGSMFNGLF
ncbi:MAG: YbaB/EbfC family nucleoid-associated protein [bacterium]|nr:YbaB/EbfC family nucleoid-associated protein [bacterium]